MPTISFFRGIKITVNYDDHNPPHFHAEYAGEDVCILINELEVLAGSIPSKQLKMVIGWAAFHQEELLEDWNLVSNGHEPFVIEGLK